MNLDQLRRREREKEREKVKQMKRAKHTHAHYTLGSRQAFKMLIRKIRAYGTRSNEREKNCEAMERCTVNFIAVVLQNVLACSHRSLPPALLHTDTHAHAERQRPMVRTNTYRKYCTQKDEVAHKRVCRLMFMPFIATENIY